MQQFRHIYKSIRWYNRHPGYHWRENCSVYNATSTKWRGNYFYFFFGEKQNLDWDVLIDLQPPYLQTFNILRYEIGQRYVPHYDAFNPAEYGPQQTQRVSPSFYNYLEFFFSWLENNASVFKYFNLKIRRVMIIEYAHKFLHLRIPLIRCNHFQWFLSRIYEENR